ncbi:MAG: amino acid permease [Bacteroidia bacterium]|nr:amino acid permease [Bacteroidia bacterium]
MVPGQLFRKKSISQVIDETDHADKLKQNLGVTDLTSLAIAAIIGAGIFSTIGNAAFDGGPAVSLLFIFTAVACSFSAMCYAEFASRVPISGSAYTYTYVSLGELLAWIIGWDLLMEYSVGNIAVAISWSDYFTSLLHGMKIDIPVYFSMDYLSAFRGFHKASEMIAHGSLFNDLPYNLKESFTAWQSAPMIGNMRIIADIPAFLIVVLITILVYVGIRESKIAGNIMVVLKLAVILMIIAVGSFYVKPGNWSPFAPNGIAGVLKGVSAVFFAYIGFDAISTTAEECKNPRKDLPKAMILSLLITTLLYVLITLVLTGMVRYKELAVGDPLAFVFQRNNLNWLSGIISLSAIIAMASVLLVFQVGQPRIWMSMSRDGLLPPRFSRIHPKFKTPSFSTIITGLVVAIPTLFTNLTEMTDLTSIGTIFAFILVCAGVLSLPKRNAAKGSGFRIPYFNSRSVLPFILVITITILILTNRKGFSDFFNFNQGWADFKQKIPTLIFLVIATFLTILAIVKEYSLIPVLGLLTNLYLISQLGITNWLRFLIWLCIGLIIYFLYSVKKSKLATKYHMQE